MTVTEGKVCKGGQNPDYTGTARPAPPRGSQAKVGPFLVRYKGLYMGGTAIVMAVSPEQAADLVRGHNATLEFENVKVEAIPFLSTPAVLFNHNGDY